MMNNFREKNYNSNNNKFLALTMETTSALLIDFVHIFGVSQLGSADNE